MLFRSNSGGIELMQGMFNGGPYVQPVVIDLKQHNHSLQLRANISGNAEILSVVVKSTTNNDDALGSLSWEEYT